MNSISILNRLFIVFTSIVISSLFSGSAGADGIRTTTLVVGVISSNPKKAFERTQPFANYLAKQLHQHHITNGQVVVAKDLRQMSEWLKKGQVDIVSETLYSASQLVLDSGAELLARRWKSGVAEYTSVFFSRIDNKVDSLADLIGKTVVFEDRGSTSAFFIPAFTLLEQSYELYQLASPREIPPEDKIGYFFSDDFSRSGGESNMISWVHRNIVASAAFSNLDWEKEIPERIKREFQIIYTSRPFPRSLMLTRGGLSPNLKKDILDILLVAHRNESGRNALKAYKKTKKFCMVTPDIRESLQLVAEKKKLIDSHLSH